MHCESGEGQIASCRWNSASSEYGDREEVIKKKPYEAKVESLQEGTPAMTTRGCIESDFETVADFLMSSQCCIFDQSVTYGY
ncbi:hypothetical protein DY000_02005020 [Brassica cretica]|uniref:Uncharacterized protein n=1 Tax=Brassica cretica TaxID=69181 RepID=A0ABQ7C577_BRACR|nr:hypothetical protein DY000_02005020 [Brassica cretica]